MSFDSSREDVQEGYQCECGGSITKSLDGTQWYCDSCNFERDVEKSPKAQQGKE